MVYELDMIGVENEAGDDQILGVQLPGSAWCELRAMPLEK